MSSKPGRLISSPRAASRLATQQSTEAPLVAAAPRGPCAASHSAIDAVISVVVGCWGVGVAADVMCVAAVCVTLKEERCTRRCTRCTSVLYVWKSMSKLSVLTTRLTTQLTWSQRSEKCAVSGAPLQAVTTGLTTGLALSLPAH